MVIEKVKGQPSQDHRRIDFIGGLILVLLTILTGFAVYGMMMQLTESILGKSLETSLQNKVYLFEKQITEGVGSTNLIATRPFLIESLQQIALNPQDEKALKALQRAAKSFLINEVTGIVFTDINGKEVVRAGQFSQNPELNIPLNTAYPSSLLWEGKIIQRTTAEIKDATGRIFGTVSVETVSPLLMQLLNEASVLGASYELAICAPLQQEMQCLPSTLFNKILKRFPRVLNGRALPMDYALKGKSGIIFAKDYRKENVVAAYAPLGKIGIGMVLKVDQAELFQPVTQQLKYVIPLLVFMVMVGILMLRWLVSPLVQRLSKSEQKAREVNASLLDSETRIRGIVDSVDVGIVTVNNEGLIETFNPAAERIFGYAKDEIAEQHITNLLPEWKEGTLNHNSESKDGESGDEASEIEGLRKDGTKFPLEYKASSVLIASQRVFIVSVMDITARKESEKRILFLANHDALTGLPNRTLLQDRIQQTICQALRSRGKSAVLFIDLDNFKTINDSLGHDVGDGLLVAVSERFVSCLRSEDTVARQGGDEFVVVLHSVANVQDAGVAAQKLLDVLKAPCMVKGHELSVGASIGIATFPDDGDDEVELLKKSDIAMYHAKETGRNNYRFFEDEMGQPGEEEWTPMI
ncbi:sensor domain-containing diguanylate cyclase [Sulfurirhabdus autotrophica]|uniref:PAS domain S-box-containing protein/diguanylate cyclase (GGDEF)-like protein n=1 Tax=Sulfurirhabdus autotrophica TaxID=1706046 RepID=A0A4R3XWJ2_9PROT|nr:sensor domain-containing diguanylate cyclase [Sulfurirhabdus autotrophica]TCV84105.1 PAS domain S-box-containing protein/diguanylate cyclase (GGDEF)-like protein [Sulfurirhabdus autotrophica]